MPDTTSPLAEPVGVNLDGVWKKDPKSITREERMALITAKRAERARWLEKQAKREAKKDEDEE